MNYKTRKLVKPPDLSPAETLMGGVLLEWIDEEASIYTMCKVGDNHVVTKYMSEIEFVNPAYGGDIVEIGSEITNLGKTSITLRCEARIKDTETVIVTIDKVVFVNVDSNGRPRKHNLTFENLKGGV